jgi:ectoine hydroxylase-related dioxygenase (phytanoyl-CoA dioxygenase family)
MDGFGHLYRVVNLHLAVDELANAFVNEVRGLAVCDRFFGARTALYTSLYYERGSEQDLHRDTPYFCTRPTGRYLGMWLALDDVDDSNGPLRVVPGSHTLPPLDVAAMARTLFPDPHAVPSSSADGWACYQGAVQRQCLDKGLTERTIHVSAGDVVIWHPEMLHGGSPHLDQQRSRRSLVTHVTPVNTPVFHMDVFFDPEKQVPAEPPWSYRTLSGREIAVFDSVDFGHEYARGVASLR